MPEQITTPMNAGRTLVIHHDDLGASHSANNAFVELSDLGAISCGSVIVPGPWFPELVSIAVERPDLDIGVHLTLTSEFDRFKWRPVTAGKSLVDEQSCFWPTVDGARRGNQGEVLAEFRQQIEIALAAGIDVTHLDSHMGTAWQPEFIEIYLDLGKEYQLPVVITDDVQQLSAPHVDIQSVLDVSREIGNPRFHRFLTTPFGNLSPTLDTYVGIFSEAISGLNWCGFHFATPGDIHLMTDDARTRIREYELFRSGDVANHLRDVDMKIVGMRAYRDQMRT